jgi:hypothetical protein
MPFVDVIDNYANGTTGTLTTTAGGTVGYTITANVSTISRPGIDLGARVTADGSQTVEVAFDDTVHGASVSVGASNPGEIYFLQVDGVTIDLNAAIADGSVVFTQGGAATHVITAAGGITSTGGPPNGSVGFFHFESPVNLISIFGTGGSSGNFDVFDIGIDSLDFNVVCFCEETEIAVPNGSKPVSEVCAGDIVSTVDGRDAKVIATNMRRIKPLELACEARLLPVRIKAGALGRGLPLEDLRLSRQHRIMIASRIAARLCGETEILVPAHALVGLPGIELDRSMQPVEYHHITLENHGVLVANGVPAESLFMGTETQQAFEKSAHETTAERGVDQDTIQVIPARKFVKGKLADQVIAAHRKHGRTLLEAWVLGASTSPCAFQQPDNTGYQASFELVTFSITQGSKTFFVEHIASG